MAELKKGKIPSKSKLRKPDGPTDDEYRARYKIFELADGTYYDSREIYWRNIPKFDEVVKITIHIRDEVHVFKNAHDGFVILSHRYVNPTYTEWCCGFIKGKEVHLTNLNFKTGKKEKDYKEKRETMNAHIHPLLKKKLNIK